MGCVDHWLSLWMPKLHQNGFRISLEVWDCYFVGARVSQAMNPLRRMLLRCVWTLRKDTNAQYLWLCAHFNTLRLMNEINWLILASKYIFSSVKKAWKQRKAPLWGQGYRQQKRTLLHCDAGCRARLLQQLHRPTPPPSWWIHLWVSKLAHSSAVFPKNV